MGKPPLEVLFGGLALLVSNFHVVALVSNSVKLYVVAFLLEPRASPIVVSPQHMIKPKKGSLLVQSLGQLGSPSFSFELLARMI